MHFRAKKRSIKKKTRNYQGLHSFNFATHDRAAFTLEEVVHEIFSNVLRKSGQRLRPNCIFSGPGKTFVVEGTELGLRHSAGASSFGREQAVHRSTQRVNSDNSAYILVEMSPSVQHSNTCAEPLEEVVHPDGVLQRYIRSI